MNKKVTLSVDSSIYKDFQKYCEENAIMLSKKVEIMMKTAMETGDGLNGTNGSTQLNINEEKNGKK